MILVIDNYDSFVFNLSRYAEELGQKVLVKRNDELSIKDIVKIKPTHIIISPGPCGPKDAGISLAAVEKFKGIIPLLGICLGHQVIGEAFGGEVIKAQKPMHGKSCAIFHDGTGIFTGIPSPFMVGRYHSLIVSATNLSPELTIIAKSLEQEIMAFSSKKQQVVGLQFHPESILTEHGHQLIANFIKGIYH